MRLFADARDYLPLHSGLEIFSLVVARMVFALAGTCAAARGARLVTSSARPASAVGLPDFAHLMSFPACRSSRPTARTRRSPFWLMARLFSAGPVAHAVLPELLAAGPAAA